MRRSLGLAVFSGMLGVTLFGIFLTPVFYYVIQRFSPAKPPAAPPPPALTPEKHDLVAVPAPSAGGSENGDARCEVWNA